MSTLKPLIRSCLLFAILALIINVLVFKFLAEPVLYEGYILPREQLGRNTNFLMGDSHAGVIRQMDLDRLNITNFAFNSESYFDVYNKLNYLVGHYEVDTLYLCVDNHTLSMYRQSWTNRARSIIFSSFTSYTEFYNISRRGYYVKKWLLFRFPILDTSHASLLKEKLLAILKGEKPMNYDHFDFSQVAEAQRIKRSRERISTQYPENGASVLLHDCLEKIISLCASENITLIGMKFPLTNEFYKELANRSYGADSVFLAHQLPVLDYSGVYLENLSYFRDQDHLNHRGSEQFVRLLESDLPR